MLPLAVVEGGEVAVDGEGGTLVSLALCWVLSVRGSSVLL